jgi:hypothetical protein
MFKTFYLACQLDITLLQSLVLPDQFPNLFFQPLVRQQAPAGHEEKKQQAENHNNQYKQAQSSLFTSVQPFISSIRHFLSAGTRFDFLVLSIYKP